MKRGFIRSLWGIPDPNSNLRQMRRRLEKIPTDLERAFNCPFPFPCKVLCFGTENFKLVSQCGFDAIQIYNEPYAVDPLKYFYQHKILAISHAMESMGYDEVVYLDFDCHPVAPVTDDIWKELGTKSDLQSCLIGYKSHRCPWRGRVEGSRCLPNGGFVYLRGKDMASRLRTAYDASGKPSNDEIALAWLLDDMDGGWKGLEHYCEIHEPLVAESSCRGACPNSIKDRKHIVFRH